MHSTLKQLVDSVPAGITLTKNVVHAGSADSVDGEVAEWSLTLDAGVRRFFEQVLMAKIGWSVMPGSPLLEVIRSDAWFEGHYPASDYDESFLIEEVLSGWIDFSDLGSMVLNSQDGELNTPLSMCSVDGGPVNPAQFYSLDSHYNLRALLRDQGQGIEDQVWLLHQGDDPWLKPTGISLERYVECAASVRGLRGWQLALLGDNVTKERIARVLPLCFPGQAADQALR